MCCEMPEYGTIVDKTVTARKEHKCIECGKIINKGDKYRYFEAVYRAYDDPWQSFKTCLKCKGIKDLAIDRYPCWPDEGPAFGRLYEWIRENRRGIRRLNYG